MRPYEKALAFGVSGGQSAESRWSRDIVHLDGCDKKPSACPGCRPIPNRVEILEERFRADAHLFLTRSELEEGVA